jgi:hypothetical protein
MIAADGLISAKVDLADWLFLIAAIVFAVATVAAYVRQTPPRDWVTCLVPLGLTLVSVALLVL